MKIVTIQLWEVSFSDNTIQPDGCSLHIDKTQRDEFIKSVYKKRGKKIPYSYERITGFETFIQVPENIWEIINNKKSVRLSEVEFNNLINLKKIIPT